MASKLSLRTSRFSAPTPAWKALAMQYSMPAVISFGSVALPTQKPGPGSEVTTVSVPSFTPSKPSTGVMSMAPQASPPAAAVVAAPPAAVVAAPPAAVVVAPPASSSSSPQAARPTRRAPVTRTVPRFRNRTMVLPLRGGRRAPYCRVAARIVTGL